MARLRLEFITGFWSKKPPKNIATPSLDGMPGHHMATPSITFAGISIYTAGWNEALRELSVLHSNPTQGTQPGLELEPSTLNITDPCPFR